VHALREGRLPGTRGHLRDRDRVILAESSPSAHTTAVPAVSYSPADTAFGCLKRLRRLGDDVSFKWRIGQTVAKIIEIWPRSFRPYNYYCRISRRMEGYAKLSLKKYNPMAVRKDDRNVLSGLL